jgi:hypothetical protein
MALILWYKTAEPYEGGNGVDRKRHATREEAEKAALAPRFIAYGVDILPFKKMPKTYCEECDEYRCICKENASYHISLD